MGIAWSLPPHQVLPSTVYKILGLYYWQCGLLKTSWIIWFIENGFASTTWDCLGQQDAFGGRLLSYFKYASVQAEVIISRWWQVNGVLCWTLRYCRYCFPWIKNKTDRSPLNWGEGMVRASKNAVKLSCIFKLAFPSFSVYLWLFYRALAKLVLIVSIWCSFMFLWRDGCLKLPASLFSLTSFYFYFIFF